MTVLAPHTEAAPPIPPLQPVRKAIPRATRQGRCGWTPWHKHHPNAPLGGCKMSGYGREQGAEALENYTQCKTARANLGGGWAAGVQFKRCSREARP